MIIHTLLYAHESLGLNTNTPTIAHKHALVNKVFGMHSHNYFI